MRNLTSHTSSLGRTIFQLGSLALLVVILFQPYVKAEVRTPTTLPTTVEGARDLLPSTPSPGAALDGAQSEAEQRISGLLPSNTSANVPRTLDAALGQEAPTQTNDYAAQRAQRGTQDDLAARGLPAVAANGDVSSLLNSGATDPLSLAALSDSIQKSYTDRFNEAAMAAAQSAWVLGIQASADCALGNEQNNKDLCSKLEEFDRKLKEVDDQAQQVLNKASRLQTMLSNKPVYLNTVSRVPVCLGLLTPGPGAAITPVNIAPALAPYNSSERLVSVETIKNIFRAITGRSQQGSSSSSSSSSDPLGTAQLTSDRNASAQTSLVAERQAKYDELYARGISNFNQTLKAGWDLAETRNKELKDISANLQAVTAALKLRPVTP